MTARCSCFVFVAPPVLPDRGQETLSWKFREGDVLKYTTEQTTTLNFKVMGKERKQKRAQSMTYTWTIKGVSADGDADITHRIDRVTMKIECTTLHAVRIRLEHARQPTFPSRLKAEVSS